MELWSKVSKKEHSTWLVMPSFFFFLMCGLLISGAKSEVYTVGDRDEWSTGTNYLQWSNKYNFTLGDILVFKYDRAQHNAYEVNETAYQSCDSSSGVLAKYETGNDQVELKEAKKYWFICNIDGHCLGGMRFSIIVNAAGGISNNTAESGPGAQPTDSPSSSVCCSAKRMSLLIFILALGLAFIAFL